MVFVATNDRSYWEGLRCRITFKSIDDSTTYFTFNGFANPQSSNPIIVTHMDTEGAVGESGTFHIVVQDSANIIAEEGLRSAKVYIELGKTQATLKFFMIGFGDIFTIGRPITGYQEYVITGFGSAIQAAQLFVHQRKAANLVNEEDPNSFVQNFTFNINRLVKDSIEKASWRPLKDVSIQDLTNWSTAGVSDKVNINVPVVNAPFTYLSDFLDRLCSLSGAVWFIDFTTGAEVFTLSYNSDLATGVTIKSGDLRVGATDDSTKTGYIKRAFNIEDNATNEAGIATRLYTTTIIDRQVITSSVGQTGSNTLNNKALAQQFIIDNDQRRIDSIAMVMSKVGEPDSPKDRVNGEIVLDVANKPTGTNIASFSIPLSGIESQAQWVFVNDLDIRQRFLSGGQTKVWIKLFQRSGNADTEFPDGKHLGDPINDPSNTIKWHSNNSFGVAQPLGTYSGAAPGGDKDLDDSLVWTTLNTGPTYSFQIMSNIRRLQARTNKQAASILRMREQFIPTDFLQDPLMVNRFLSLNLSQMSKPKRSIADYQVTIPNDFIYKPYQWVTFVDGLSGIAQELQVKRVRYILSSTVQDSPIGALHAEIALGGSYNPLIGDCSCG